jgi:hypothetical protein
MINTATTLPSFPAADPGRELITRELWSWTHPREVHCRDRFRRKNISRAIRAAAERMCIRVGRRWPPRALTIGNAKALSLRKCLSPRAEMDGTLPVARQLSRGRRDRLMRVTTASQERFSSC